ncbi:MAG: YncE family protein [Elusimicrobia bacterium]|nr:YncE family protein [Elusimicrobiota bacterium]
MNPLHRFAAGVLLLGWTASCPALAAAPVGSAYRLSRALPIGGAGGWDYMTVDSEHGLLFATRSTHTQVIKAATGKVVADIPGQKRSHGVALVPSAGRGFISDGGDGSVEIFDLKTYAVLGKIAVEPDADGIIYDPASGKVLVVSGDGGSLIPISPDVDPKTGKAGPNIALGGKPEGLVSDGKGRVYVDLADKGMIAVVDMKAMKTVAWWPTLPGEVPTGLAIDPRNRRLFVGCRNPRKLVIMDADDGKVLAALPIGAGNDATGFDEGAAFASGGDGSLTVVREVKPGEFAVTQTVRTRPGARTLGVDRRTHALYLPTATFGKKVNPRGWPVPEPGTFEILQVSLKS